MEHEAVKRVCREVLEHCRSKPGIRVTVICGYSHWIDEVLKPALFAVADQNSHEFEYDSKSHRLGFGNGSVLEWRAYDHPEKIKGWEAHVIWFARGSYEGQSPNMVAQIYTSCRMRLRANEPEYPTVWIDG